MRKYKAIRVLLLAVLTIGPLFIIACSEQNDMVLGTAPAYTTFFGTKRVDILDRDHDTLAIFFNQCVSTDKAGGGAWSLADFGLDYATVDDFNAEIPSSGLYNFDQSFGSFIADSFSVGDTLTWVEDTEKLACSSGYGAKLLITRVDTDPFWPLLPGDTLQAVAYRLSTEEHFVPEGGAASNTGMELYFIVRNRTEAGDTGMPYIATSYPANKTGIDEGTSMPLPPHYPMSFSFSEPVLNISTLQGSVEWAPGWSVDFPPHEEPYFPDAYPIILDHKDFGISFNEGLPPGSQCEIFFLSRPDDYEADAYGTGLDMPPLNNILSPPTIDLFGNAIGFPNSMSITEDPPGSGIYSANYSNINQLGNFAYQARVAPLIIDYPAPGDVVSDLTGKGVSFRALPSVDSVQLSLDNWSGDPVTLSIANGLLAPLSRLTRPEDTPGSLMPRVSGDGSYLVYWAPDASDRYQVWRKNLQDPAADPKKLSDFGPFDSEEGPPELLGHPPAVSHDGSLVVFRSTRDLENDGSNANGEIYYWLEDEVSGNDAFIQLTVGDTALDAYFENQPVYAPAASNYNSSPKALFWTDSDIGPAGGNSGHNHRIASCSLSHQSANVRCEFVTNVTTLSPKTVHPALSTDREGYNMAFVSEGDHDGSNSEGNAEIFLTAFGDTVSAITDSGTKTGGTVVWNDTPVIVENGEILFVYFVSNGNYDSENPNIGDSSDLFVYREWHDNSDTDDLFAAIEAITHTPEGGYVANPAVADLGLDADALAIIANISIIHPICRASLTEKFPRNSN